MKKPRPLTHDELKAAEAAFQGLPLDPRWTDAAQAVHVGIVSALAARAGKPGRRQIAAYDPVTELETVLL